MSSVWRPRRSNARSRPPSLPPSPPTPSSDAPLITHLFVYGTLQPGDVRWHHLSPFVVDDGWPDTTIGRLFDTGLGFPAAIFDGRAAPGGTIVGHTYPLLTSTLSRCLELLDEVEGVVEGEYRRVTLTTGSGATAWAYEYGDGLELVEIASGRWLDHRGS